MANKRRPRLSPVVLCRKFGAGMTTRNYRDQEIVFSPGDTADAVFYIQSGTVKLTAVSTGPKKAIIAFLHCAIQRHSLAKGEHGSHAQARPAVCRAVCCILAFADCSNRGRPGQSILQFQREATGAGSAAVWAK